MFSFQNDAFYFIAGEKVTVRTLVRLGLAHAGQCIIPNQFYEMGWGKWLPMPNITLIPYFSYCVASGINKGDIIRYLEQKAKPYTFIDFSLKRPLNITEMKNEEFELLYAREVAVKLRLELSGYEYPRNMIDVVNLYVSLGLAFELQDENSQRLLDLIVWPLAPIDSILSV